jgi:hypothetical protein
MLVGDIVFLWLIKLLAWRPLTNVDRLYLGGLGSDYDLIML